MNIKFFKCSVCGKVIAIIGGCSTCPTICCGKPMEEIVANTQDGALEKHVPVYEIKDNIVTVKVGSIPHPMIESHYIEWVMLVTNLGNQRKVLSYKDEPIVQFALLPDEKVITVLEKCNIHGLYKTK